MSAGDQGLAFAQIVSKRFNNPMKPRELAEEIEYLKINFMGDGKKRYERVHVLGFGGNCVVYLVLATSAKFKGCFFALKVFAQIEMEPRLARFKAECEILRDINHPAIMKVFDRGSIEIHKDNVTREYPFMVSEYLPKTLSGVSFQNSTHVQRTFYSMHLLSALMLMNSENPQILHRDIKPPNIFVKGNSCILGDFGLMKLIGSDDEDDFSISPDGERRMPAHFVTPDLLEEEKGGAPATTKSDIFQLGLVLSILFTGKNPQTEYKKDTGDLQMAEISSIMGKEDENIRDILSSMLKINPAERPSAEDCLGVFRGIFESLSDPLIRSEGRIFLPN